MEEMKNTDVHEDIAIRLVCGDESVIGDLLTKQGYAPAIMHVLCDKYTGVLTEEDIEDVVAVAIRKLWDYREQYDESKGSVRSLLFRIADNYAKDVLKHGWHKTREMMMDVPPGDGNEPIAQLARLDRHLSEYSADETGHTPEQKKLCKAVMEAFNELRKEWQIILKADSLCNDGNASNKELASRLNCPVNSVGVWRMRAHQELRAKLASRGLVMQARE